MKSNSNVKIAYDLRRRERFVLVPMFMLAGYATWYWTSSPLSMVWMTAMIICCFIDVAVFRYAARRPVLTPATARLLLAWVLFYATGFVMGGFLALSSNHPDAAIAVMAGLTCATVRNASDFSVSPAVGTGSVLPSISTAFAVPVMAPSAWQDPISTTLTLAAVLAMVGYTMLHSIRRAMADRSTVAIARLDPLTKLLNRRAFIEGAELRFLGRNEEPFGLLFIDLNGFKAVNDLQGHRAGDLLLQAVAAKLGTRSELECIARIGGDEFAALTFGSISHETLEAVAAALAEPMVIEGRVIAISASIGLAMTPGSAKSLTELMQQADFAMLWAKARRAGVRIFDATLEHELNYDLRREAEIRSAIPLGQFIPFYQPLIDLDTGRTIGWEVLMRWDHPTRGIVAPAEFIDVAEATGLIDEMFWPMLTTACRATCAHTDGSFIAVNVTLRQIMDARFVSRLSDVLRQTEFAPQRLEIEITEREHVHDIDRLAAGLQALGALGVRIALDDFGTGSANLTLLSALPIHKLKIDRSFVSNIEHDEQNRRIVTSIVGLARSMDLICTAEGIESQAVAQRLRDLGCHQGQGYFFGRPSLHHDLRADRKLAPMPAPGRRKVAV